MTQQSYSQAQEQETKIEKDTYTPMFTAALFTIARTYIYTHTHIYGIQKDGTDEPICRAAMETQTQKTDLWTRCGGGEEGEGGMYGESNMETYITTC